MSIVISIVKLPEGAVDTKATHTFAHQGGTIGRSPENDWVVEDTECFISSQHSQISFEHGQYYITDLSTNGTFSNGSAVPIGKGNTIKLNDGDKFSLGEYEFLASVWQAEQQTAAINHGPFSDSVVATAHVPQQDYFSSASPLDVDNFASPFSVNVSNTDSLFSPEPLETDPLAAIDNAWHIPDTNQINDNVFSAVSQSDQADPMQQSVIWPESKIESGSIPENWENDIFGTAPEPALSPVAKNNADFLDASSPVSISQSDFSGNEVVAEVPVVDKKSELEKTNEKILAEIAILKKQAQRQALKEQIEKNTQSSDAVLKSVNTSTSATNPTDSSSKSTTINNEKSLVDALGLSSHNLSDEKVVEINQIVGDLVQETIKGMMQVLSSRSSIKNEFRMNVTTIQPVENNPLKFSANVSDAIENMFIKDGNAYKKPVEAIKEGFEGIAEHQIAILAGIRTAFKGVLNRFDPSVLEQRFEQFNKPGIIPGMSKAKNWDSYKRYYSELVDDMDNSFQHLFGYEFVQAYEEQLQKLTISRKTNN